MIGKEDNRYSLNHIDLIINGQYISDSKTIANSYNNYFINIRSSLASSIKSEIDPILYFQTNKKFIYIPEIKQI